MRCPFIALAVLALAAAPADAAQPGPAPAETLMVETAPGVRLHVERYGGGPNVIIAPGRLFLAEDFRALARPDRTLILYDMRSRGASSPLDEPASLTILDEVRDLEAIRARFGAERASLIGYSYLGLMVALYAAEHPERIERIVQIGPVPRQFGTAYPDGERAGEESLSAEGRAAWAAWGRASKEAGDGGDQLALCRLQSAAMAYWLVGDPANAARVGDNCAYENERPARLEKHFDALWGDIVRHRSFPASMFAGLSAPVLIVHGTADRNAPYGAGLEWARTWAEARLVTVAGAGHNPWLEDPAVVPDIDRFLAGTWPARAGG